MKIGGYTRAVYDFAKETGMTRHDLKVLLALGDEMWMGIDDLIYTLVLSRYTVVTSLKKMKEHNYIKVSRTENSFKGLCRMYSITQKGRDTVRAFINYLK